MSKSLTASLKIALAQCNFHVGDIPGNTAKIIEAAKKAADDGAQLIVFLVRARAQNSFKPAKQQRSPRSHYCSPSPPPVV